ncbi:hypothetical protein LTR66_004129 [Elasticomyces elasticus]|nr:hypothetical protein LTR66_004129 [Elasticomyces elasticus]
MFAFSGSIVRRSAYAFQLPRPSRFGSTAVFVVRRASMLHPPLYRTPSPTSCVRSWLESLTPPSLPPTDKAGTKRKFTSNAALVPSAKQARKPLPDVEPCGTSNRQLDEPKSTSPSERVRPKTAVQPKTPQLQDRTARTQSAGEAQEEVLGSQVDETGDGDEYVEATPRPANFSGPVPRLALRKESTKGSARCASPLKISRLKSVQSGLEYETSKVEERPLCWRELCFAHLDDAGSREMLGRTPAPDLAEKLCFAIKESRSVNQPGTATSNGRLRSLPTSH